MPQDTLDKLSPTSLAMVGHVLIAVIPQLEQKFARPALPSFRESGRIAIDSENGRYEVVYGAGVLSRAGAGIGSLGENRGVFLLCSPRVARHWRATGAALRSAGLRRTIIFDDREEAKKIATVERLCRELVRAGADRRAVIVAAGGGVVGDVAGFVAASYLRGVAWCTCPPRLSLRWIAPSAARPA